MKKILLAVAMIASLGATSPMVAQSHRHTPRTAASANVADTAGVEAFSDTTAVDSAGAGGTQTMTYSYTMDEDDIDEAFSMLDDMGKHFIFPIVVLVIVFLLCPLLILGSLFFFLYKYRKQKIKLAELAIEKGQPIPSDIVNDVKPQGQASADVTKNVNNANMEKGVKNVFLGLGITLLGFFVDSLVVGIGLLVMCMGAGQCVIARIASKKEEQPTEE